MIVLLVKFAGDDRRARRAHRATFRQGNRKRLQVSLNCALNMPTIPTSTVTAGV